MKVQKWWGYIVIIAVLTSILSARGQSFITNELISYFPLSGNLNASFGNGYAIANNNTVLTSDRFGIPNSAYYFNGSSSYAILSVPNIPTNSEPRTISFWMQSQLVGAPSANEHVVGYGSFPTLEAFGIYISTSSTLAGYLGFDDVHTTYGVPNQWVFVAETYNGTNDTVYVNGLEVGNETATIATQGNNLFAIGARYATEQNGAIANFFNGSLSNIRIYSRALSTNEVSQLYSIESSPPPALGIIAYSNNPVVVFPAATNTYFSVQMATNLSSPVWVNVTNGVPFSGIQITNAPTNAFFRLN